MHTVLRAGPGFSDRLISGMTAIFLRNSRSNSDAADTVNLSSNFPPMVSAATPPTGLASTVPLKVP